MASSNSLSSFVGILNLVSTQMIGNTSRSGQQQQFPLGLTSSVTKGPQSDTSQSDAVSFLQSKALIQLAHQNQPSVGRDADTFAFLYGVF